MAGWGAVTVQSLDVHFRTSECAVLGLLLVAGSVDLVKLDPILVTRRWEGMLIGYYGLPRLVRIFWVEF